MYSDLSCLLPATTFDPTSHPPHSVSSPILPPMHAPPLTYIHTSERSQSSSYTHTYIVATVFTQSQSSYTHVPFSVIRNSRFPPFFTHPVPLQYPLSLPCSQSPIQCVVQPLPLPPHLLSRPPPFMHQRMRRLYPLLNQRRGSLSYVLLWWWWWL